MKNKFGLFLTILLFLGITMSCENDSQDPINNELNSGRRLKSDSLISKLNYSFGVDSTMAYCGNPLLATFSTKGTVKFINNEDSLYIQIKLTPEWYIQWISVFAGNIEDMPQGTDGYPDYYRWDTYTEFPTPYPQEITLKFSYNDIPDCSKVFIKMFVVKYDENGNIFRRYMGWVEGTQYDTHEAYYNEFCKQTCCIIDDVKYNLVAGKHKLVGDVTVTNDDDNLYVTYNTKDGWSLNETHLYVGTYMGLPRNRHGVPVPGKFPYKEEHADGTTSYTYTIALSSIKLYKSCLIIAAHAVVEKDSDLKCGGGNYDKTETAWSVGKEFSSRRWGWYSSYCIQKCE